MAEYIERDKIFSVWRSIPAPASVTSLAAAISQTPAADVAPVRHGKWVKEPPYKSIGGEYLKALICSKCNSFFVSDGNKPWQMHNYCPNCGAKMDGEEQDDE